MNRSELEENKRALAVVAHPDDETIWMGGTILKHEKIKWTIFSLSRASDTDRAPKFKKACRAYKAKPIIADLDDEGRLNLGQRTAAAEKIIARELKNKRYHYIFTHGENGEYGHLSHIAVSLAVKSIAKTLLKPEAVFCFNYKKARSKQNSGLDYKSNSDMIVKLTAKEHEEKKRIVADVYGYQYNGIDVGYCTNPEAFKIIK